VRQVYVCDAILEICQFTGIGAILVSGNGTHFTCELNKEILKRLGCAPRFITQSHPMRMDYASGWWEPSNAC